MINFARLTSDGTLDTAFNFTTNNSENGVGTFAVQPNGKIVIAGNFFRVNGAEHYGLARLNPDGSTDASFNSGLLLLNGGVGLFALQPDGGIIISGIFPRISGTTRHSVARLNSNGSLDTTFNLGDAGDQIRALVLQPDGKIVIAGWFLNYNGTVRDRIARLNSDGSLDTSFVPVNGNTIGSQTPQRIGALALQPDGKVVVGSIYLGDKFGASPNRLFRLNTDGSLDSSFPITGTDIEGITTNVHAILIQPDKNIVSAANSMSSTAWRASLWRESSAQPPLQRPRLLQRRLQRPHLFQFQQSSQPVGYW